MSFHITQFIATMVALTPLFSSHSIYLEKHWIFVNTTKAYFMFSGSLAISLSDTISFWKWSTFIEKNQSSSNIYLQFYSLLIAFYFTQPGTQFYFAMFGVSIYVATAIYSKDHRKIFQDSYLLINLEIKWWGISTHCKLTLFFVLGFFFLIERDSKGGREAERKAKLKEERQVLDFPNIRENRL